jgi:hypothetical protein
MGKLSQLQQLVIRLAVFRKGEENQHEPQEDNI